MIQQKEITASAEWSAPSNLAIVKYWGKKGVQEPLNPSISFSLKHAITTTRVEAKPAEEPGFDFHLDGKPQPSFNEKIGQFLDKIRPYLPFLRNHHLHIESSNTFPHSSGIASSASSMSALALCLAKLHHISQGKQDESIDLMMASGLARLGSGSASRSVYGGWTLWGKHTPVKESSDMYAIAIGNEQVHPVFSDLRNAILLIDPGKKGVSSTLGHQLMENHPYREARIQQARQNTARLLETLKTGNWDDFTEIAENEALSLHGLMMSSTPSYTLLHPNSLSAIAEIRNIRKNKGLQVCFSMDAGPNIHLLYPKNEDVKVKNWIEEKLKPLCHEGRIIYDEVGQGPKEH